ncbi:MAG: hypothetical protein ACC646_03045 [Paracoccaceae bacterium]
MSEVVRFRAAIFEKSVLGLVGWRRAARPGCAAPLAYDIQWQVGPDIASGL